jgi:DNA (cytosine-5)-methyltransferase 1
MDQLPRQIPMAHAISQRGCSGNGDGENAENADTSGEGSGIEWVECPDGKSRPVKRGIRLLAHGVQHRAPILHAFGNAIVPQVAAEFIKSSGESLA